MHSHPHSHSQARGGLGTLTDIPIHDQIHLAFRAEAFNVFNHPIFGPVYNGLSYGPTQFGYAYNTANSEGNLDSLYQAGGPRSLQVALKVSF